MFVQTRGVVFGERAEGGAGDGDPDPEELDPLPRHGRLHSGAGGPRQDRPQV